jgi:hypothetical protein
VLAEFSDTAAQRGIPASTLTGNGILFTAALPAQRGA